MLVEKGKKMLLVQLTYACNLNCKHCAYKDIQNSPVLSFPDFAEILYTHDCDVIKISGGEATILKNIDMYIREAKQYAETILYTNLLKIPKEKPDGFLVSFYGLGYHKLITRGVQSIKNSLSDGIESLISSNILELVLSLEKVTINTPVFSFEQMKSALLFADYFDLPLRIVKLIAHGGASKIEVLAHEDQLKIAEKCCETYEKAYYTCSLGGEPRCKDKITITPTGEKISCTAEVRSVKCARRSKRLAI